MAQPVWVLSVDLQTKTATFQTGLADAAKAARGSFNDIKSGAGEMSGAVGYSTGEARHSVMMLGEEFGVHLPRSLTTFIAGLGPIGPALEAAFPFLAIILGATLLIEHLSKLHEAGEKLTADQLSFGTAAQNAFNTLDEKIRQAEIKADELRGDHLAALKLQLESIDHQSMEELVHNFDVLAKAADVVMKDLEGHWYTFGTGSDGAKHALEEFQAKYASMLAQGKDSDAGNLLQGTLDTARKILNAQELMKAGVNVSSTDHSGETAQYNEVAQAHIALRAAGVGWTEKEIQAQQQLVDVLNDQVGVENRVAVLQEKQGQNIKTEDAKKDGTAAAEKLRKYAELQERLEREMAENVKQAEQDAVDATEAGTTERLAAIQHAMATERSLYGTNTEAYRKFALEYLKTNAEMYKQLEEVSRKADEEAAQQQAEAGREQAESTEKAGELTLQADTQNQALLNSRHVISAALRVAQEQQNANILYGLKMEEALREEAALDKNGKDYLAKLAAIQNKEKQLTQAHENELTAIKDKAEEERNQRILAADNQLNDSIARGLTASIMGHQTWAKMLQSLGNQVVSGMLENAVKSMLADDMTKERDAAHAARKAFNIGIDIGGPAGMVLGPLFGAGAFAAVMAFAGGTDRVPGMSRGDTVPAMLSPGEGVVPGGVMDGLRNLARNGNMGTTHVTHVHVRPTYNLQALDGDGISDVLDKHTDQLTRHFENTLRRMNR